MKTALKVPGLQQEILPASDWRQVRRIMGGTLLLFFILGQVFWLFFAYDSDNPTYRVAEYKWRMIQDLHEPVDVLVFGDSAAGASVVPEVIQQVSGLRTLNLAVAQGISAVSDLWLLDAYLKRFGAPKWVVWCREDSTWRIQVPETKYLMQFPLTPWEWITLDFKPPFSLSDWGHLFLMLAFPVMRPDVRIQHRLVLDASPRTQFAVTQSGGVVIWGVDREFKAGLQLQSRDESPELPFMLPLNATSLQQVLLRARERKFRVLIVAPPIYDKFVHGDRLDRIRKLRLVFSQLARQEPLVTFDETLYRYNKSQMRDMDHVPYTTALDYSRRLGKVLVAHREK